LSTRLRGDDTMLRAIDQKSLYFNKRRIEEKEERETIIIFGCLFFFLGRR